jgi:hypothetical protein
MNAQIMLLLSATVGLTYLMVVDPRWEVIVIWVVVWAAIIQGSPDAKSKRKGSADDAT